MGKPDALRYSAYTFLLSQPKRVGQPDARTILFIVFDSWPFELERKQLVRELQLEAEVGAMQIEKTN